jgi:hypothetical protein
MIFEVLSQVLITYPRKDLDLTVLLFLMVYCVCNVLHLNSTPFLARNDAGSRAVHYLHPVSWPSLISARLAAAIVHRPIMTAFHRPFPFEKTYA